MFHGSYKMHIDAAADIWARTLCKTTLWETWTSNDGVSQRACLHDEKGSWVWRDKKKWSWKVLWQQTSKNLKNGKRCPGAISDA